MHHGLLLNLLTRPINNLQQLADSSGPLIEHSVRLSPSSKPHNASWPINTSMQCFVCHHPGQMLLGLHIATHTFSLLTTICLCCMTPSMIVSGRMAITLLSINLLHFTGAVHKAGSLKIDTCVSRFRQHDMPNQADQKPSPIVAEMAAVILLKRSSLHDMYISACWCLCTYWQAKGYTHDVPKREHYTNKSSCTILSNSPWKRLFVAMASKFPCR